MSNHGRMRTEINVFDRVLKILARNYVASFVHLALPHVALRLTGAPENVDIAVAETRADFVHRVMTAEGEECALHLEFQTRHDRDVPERMFLYSALLTRQLNLPVITVVFYLMPRVAALPSSYEVVVDGVTLNRFEYQVVKLWEYADEIRAGTWAELAPLLVMLEKEPDETVLAREKELILQETEKRKRADLLSCAVTIGTRYFDKEFLWRFFREEVEIMREASFIEDWLEEKLQEGFQQGLQQGLQQGMQQGRLQGMQQGVQQGMQRGLSQLLQRRFGELPHALEIRLTELPTATLQDLLDAALDAPSLDAFQVAMQDLLVEQQLA